MSEAKETLAHHSADARAGPDLLEQYGCGPIRFSGHQDALYERHLLFDRHWGDPIALNIKQHRAPTVHTPPSDFHNLSDHAAIGSISVGSLFLTLQEALDEIEP